MACYLVYVAAMWLGALVAERGARGRRGGRRTHRDDMVRRGRRRPAIAAWGGIALVRTRSSGPDGRGKTSSTSDRPARRRADRPPERRLGYPGAATVIRGAVARDAGEPGSGCLAALASPLGAGDPRGRVAPCRRCFGSPVLSAAGLGADVPHGVQHGLSTRIKTIVDHAVAEYTALNLPMLQTELDHQAARNRARSYRPGEGLEPEFEGLPLDPEPQPVRRSCSRSRASPKRRMPASRPCRH